MKATVVFVILQFVLGLGFAIGGIFLFVEYERFPLNASILIAFAIGFFCMLTGVGLAGYFHLKIKQARNSFGRAMTVSFAATVLFLVLYLLIKNFLPSNFEILSLFIPLTGAVFGFNLIATQSAITIKTHELYFAKPFKKGMLLEQCSKESPNDERPDSYRERRKRSVIVAMQFDK